MIVLLLKSKNENASSSSKERYLKCIEAQDNFLSDIRKLLSLTEKGADFYLKMINECERNTINFISNNNSSPKNKLLQIEDAPFLKEKGYSNKWEKAYYEINSKSSKKQDSSNQFELRIANSESCKPKGRLSKNLKINLNLT